MFKVQYRITTRNVALNAEYYPSHKQWSFSLYVVRVNESGQDVLAQFKTFYIPLAMNSRIDIEEG